MKENSPEKIYVPKTNSFGDGGTEDFCVNHKTFEDDIEYIRTDAFIEKACKFFAPYIQDNSGGYDREIVLKNFENYIKGE